MKNEPCEHLRQLWTIVANGIEINPTYDGFSTYSCKPCDTVDFEREMLCKATIGHRFGEWQTLGANSFRSLYTTTRRSRECTVCDEREWDVVEPVEYRLIRRTVIETTIDGGFMEATDQLERAAGRALADSTPNADGSHSVAVRLFGPGSPDKK